MGSRPTNIIASERTGSASASGCVTRALFGAQTGMSQSRYPCGSKLCRGGAHGDLAAGPVTRPGAGWRGSAVAPGHRAPSLCRYVPVALRNARSPAERLPRQRNVTPDAGGINMKARTKHPRVHVGLLAGILRPTRAGAARRSRFACSEQSVASDNPRRGPGATARADVRGCRPTPTAQACRRAGCPPRRAARTAAGRRRATARASEARCR